MNHKHAEALGYLRNKIPEDYSVGIILGTGLWRSGKRYKDKS